MFNESSFKFTIDKQFIDTEKHLNWNEGFFWSENQENLVYGEEKNLNYILEISAENFLLEFQKKYHNVFNQTQFKNPKQSDFFKILSEKDKKDHIKTLVENIKKSCGGISKENILYFTNVLPKRLSIIKKMKEFSISNEILESHLCKIENETLKSTLLSFKDKSFVEYENFGTKTGRLSIKNGVNILTLKKEFRDIFKSQFLDGKLIYIDFKSLEINLLLNEIENSNLKNALKEQKDIYTFFAGKLNIEREIIKNIIISIVYGSSTESISKKFNIDLLYSEKICSYLKKLLCIDELSKRFLSEFKLKNKITNSFGRSIKVEDGDGLNGNKLINYYLQSNGADISLLMFNQFYDDFISKKENEIKPIFIIHDCLVLDVEKKYIDQILNTKILNYKNLDLNVTVGFFNNN